MKVSKLGHTVFPWSYEGAPVWLFDACLQLVSRTRQDCSRPFLGPRDGPRL